MPAAQTGVVTENRYADPRMWNELYQELVYGAIGTGVAIGDYDGDGRPDLFIVSKTERSRLFRNLGNWRFEDVTDRAGIDLRAAGWSDKAKGWVGLGGGEAEPQPWKQGATFVDVNNDGRLDLYVCRFGAPNLLYVNQGDGTFKEEAAARGLAVSDASGMAAFCDYDRDGWLDVYLVTNMLDAAGHPSGQRDYLFHANGDGTFADVSAAAGIAGEAAGHSATWWDYDGDGWPDLYVANDYAVPDHLYHNNRDGTFTDTIDRVVPHMPYYSMGSDLGDVNNDGLIDFFAADMSPTTHAKDQRGMAGSRARAQMPPGGAEAPQYMRNALYVNTGTGRCLEAAFMAGLTATDWTWSPRLEDLDNDGRLDLCVTNGMIREYHNADLLDRIMGGESVADSRRIVRASPVLAERNLAFRNLGDLRFVETGAAWGLDELGVSFGSAFGDLDGDGDLDLVYGNYEKGATLLRNDSDSGHRLVVALRGTRSNRFGIGATVRIETAAGVQVRPLVLARGALSSSEPIAHFGLGDDARVRRLTVAWPSGIVQEFRDLAADRRLTITEPDAPPPPNWREPPAPAPTQFEEVAPPAAVAANLPAALAGNDVVAAADFDRDGRLDYFAARTPAADKYPLPSRGTLFAGRDGRLEDVTQALAPGLRAPGLVRAALWSDVDGDGWPDLLLALEWGEVKFYRNREGKGFDDRTAEAGFATAGTGWWSALAAADCNGDGRSDYVAGNLGLNTRHQASAEFPALLFYGDFGGGPPMALEGYYEDGRLYPWITRAELGARISAILRRFPRNDAYARATLGEIVGEPRLAAARKFAATELRSGVFLSQPDGTFRFTPLPRIAQIAPLRGIVTGDFDGDGRADVYAVQNSHAPRASVGRFDGGLSQLLRGDGRGGFAAVPVRESGLIVPGEGKAVAAADLDGDGWADLVVTRGDGSRLAFRNRGTAGGGSLRVTLRGAEGNPLAAGARVTAIAVDGGMQTCELSDAMAGTCFVGNPAANAVRRVSVRWPTGATSEREVPAAARAVEIAEGR